MNLTLDNPVAYANHQNKDGSLHISLPKVGVSITFDKKESDLLYSEVSRFYKETLTHSQYVLKRFKVQHAFLTSCIQTLIKKGFWDRDGFKFSALDKEGKEFGYECENLLALITGAFCFSKQLKEFMDDLPVKTTPEKAIGKWESICAVKSLPSFDESEWKGEWKVPLRFTSSSTLAGMVKPIIFHDGSLNLSLNSGKIKLYIEKDEAFALFYDMLTHDQLSNFNTAEQAWNALKELDSGVRRFIKKIKENGYDSDMEYFDQDTINIDNIHSALLELHEGIVCECKMEELNRQYNKN